MKLFNNSKNLKSIIEVTDFLMKKDVSGAKEIIDTHYPHRSVLYGKRKLSTFEKLSLFIRDGFIDRYTGDQLVFPNVLRLISFNLTTSFPYHTNWKMAECHIAYWEFMPTCDHIVPITKGGSDSYENLVTTSMKNNLLKSNFLLNEIGVVVKERGNIEEWNGLIAWYKSYIRDKPMEFFDDSMKRWHRALIRYEKENGEI
ncbi:HNH endonuclease domain protein [Leptospira noguchii str. Cascata]|nr:HNH endonuclease domain protein [Leptospira noguchii str. Bonito]EMS84570.1 HNH endonuclease domain protein [Leptospira noguchii str. Cascata]